MIVSIAEEMNATRRCTMEDCVVVYGPEFFEQESNKEPWHLLGVYDGHGGRDIVEFLEASLGKIIKQELLASDDASISERLERSFLLADIISFQRGIKTSGATVVVCLIRHHPSKKQATIYTANCGDARAVLASASSSPTIRLSHDHKAEDPEEIERITKAGGFVVRGRVSGILAVARSLGDHMFKEYVIGTPYISQHHVQYDNLPEAERSFVILACDGLWDVLSDESAVQLVRNYVASSPDPAALQEGAAQILIHEALRLNSGDNISVIVAFF